GQDGGVGAPGPGERQRGQHGREAAALVGGVAGGAAGDVVPGEGGEDGGGVRGAVGQVAVVVVRGAQALVERGGAAAPEPAVQVYMLPLEPVRDVYQIRSTICQAVA